MYNRNAAMTDNHGGSAGRIVVSPEGRIDTATAKKFWALLDQAMTAGNGRIIVDLARVEYITSAGLGTIINAARKAKAGGGTLVICGAAGCVRDVLEISGLARIVPTAATLEEALTG
jgi:anti-anti-sigma factor